MIKYDVVKESIKINAEKRFYSSDEILEYYFGHMFCDPDLVKSCDTLKEAEVIFDCESAKCTTFMRDLNGNDFIVADIVYVLENEYDEDGELVCSHEPSVNMSFVKPFDKYSNKELKEMKIYTADREAGNKIEEFSTIEEAKEAIAAYEEEDKKDGTYTPNFYDIVNENCESIL